MYILASYIPSSQHVSLGTLNKWFEASNDEEEGRRKEESIQDQGKKGSKLRCVWLWLKKTKVKKGTGI
jgi:hypothetical protein